MTHEAVIRDVMSDITEDYDLRVSTSQDLFIAEDALPILHSQQQGHRAPLHHHQRNHPPSALPTSSFASPPRRSNNNRHDDDDDDDNPPAPPTPTFLSPFSSKAVSMRGKKDDDLYQLSLHATRPVSIVVHVTNPIRAATTKSAERIPCVFPPLVAMEGKLSNDDASSIMTSDEAKTHQHGNNDNNIIPPSPTTATLTATAQTKDLVIINPTAFGVALPNQVSLDILNSITRVARISSEDWVRLYRFHQVWWPRGVIEGLDRLATAISHDVTTVGSIAQRLVIGMGSSSNQPC